MSNQTQSAPASSGMEAALRRAEMQTMQLALEARFNENMALFKSVSAELYEQYKNYEPKELRISWDQDGYLNLVNYQLNNKPVYAEDPATFCDKQTDQFMQKPLISAINFKATKIHNPHQIYPRFINQLVKEVEDLTIQSNPSCKDLIPTLLMMGVGLGYQIPKLIKQIDIKNLIIFDPHKDSFYASLHVIDWRPIVTHFCSEGRMLKLLIDMEPEDGMAELKLLTDKIGLFKLVYTHIFRHFQSKEEEKFTQLYRKEFHINASGTGYFDDEQVSLAHTAANLNNKIAIFKDDARYKNFPPIFVIGNGPSLDLHIDLIEKNRGNAIIMSCGTALTSLRKVNIKPDLHVEMERNFNITDWLNEGTSQKFRDGITLLCLNTASPAVLKLFNEVCMAKKTNDIGESMIDNTLPGIKSLQLCNPTVTNAGLAFSIAMGFHEIYLLGVDLGTPKDKHHSKFSIYYDLEKKNSKHEYTPFKDKKNSYMIEGNFSDEVSTSLFLDSTRINMQLLIRYAKRQFPELKVFNPNLGALIHGAEPIKNADIRNFSPIEHKEKILNNLKSKHFMQYEKPHETDQVLSERYLKDFFNIRKELILPKDIRDSKELYTALNERMEKIIKRKKTNPITAMLLRGSLQGFYSMMMKYCLFQQTPSDFKNAYLMIRKQYMQFLKEAYNIMETIPFKLDDSHDERLVGSDETSRKNQTKQA